MAIEIDYYITMVSKIMRTINLKRTLPAPNSPKKKRSKWKIPPQTPPFPFATSEFKNKSAEVLANPFPKK